MSAASSMPSYEPQGGTGQGHGPNGDAIDRTTDPTTDDVRATAQVDASVATHNSQATTGDIPAPRGVPAERALPSNVIPLRPRDRAFVPRQSVPFEANSHDDATENSHGVADEQFTRSRWAELPFIGVMSLVVVAIVVSLVGALWTGVLILTAAVAVAFVLRAILPDAKAGMLKSRGKSVDLAVLAALGLLLLVLVLPLPLG